LEFAQIFSLTNATVKQNPSRERDFNLDNEKLCARFAKVCVNAFASGDDPKKNDLIKRKENELRGQGFSAGAMSRFF
jgi:hypothetical protein